MENVCKYHNIFLNTIGGFFQCSPKGHFIMVNPAFAYMLGYDSPEELLNTVTDMGKQLYVNAEDYDICIQQLLKNGSYSFGVNIYRKDGSIAWIYINVRIVRDINGNIEYFEGVAQDSTQSGEIIDHLIKVNEKLNKEIAQRKSIEGKLKLSEARLEALLKLNQMTEESLKEITDFTLEEGIRLTGSSVGYIAFYDEDKKELEMHSWSKSSMKQCAITDKPYIYPIEKTGLWGEAVRQRKPIVTNDYSAPNPFKKGYPKGHVHLLRHMNIPVFDGQRIVMLAGVGNKKEDYDESDVNQLNLLMSGMWRIIQRKRAEETLRKYRDHLEDMVDERTKLLQTTLAKLQLEIAERKQAVVSLKTERQKLYSLLDGLPAIIYLRDSDYNISFSNRYFWDFFDKPKNKRCFEVIHNKQEPCEGCPSDRVLKTKIPETWERMYSNGRIFEVYTYPFQDINASPLVLNLFIDITSRKQFEQEMTRLSRLNLIGQMAAGIAHEIRNPMTTVRGFLQLLGQKDKYRQDKEYFNLMIQELDRANSIITEFLSLAKNRAAGFKKQNLNHIVQSLFPLIQADAMESAKYVTLELNEIPNLLLDEKEIRQLILNLTRNGLEALLSGGHLTIKTYLDDCEVVLSVQDHGRGIPEDVLDKIGTPFFTTKDNGTGLGLATCYSIAIRHNAGINFDTGPGGTTFYVRFKIEDIKKPV
ncbi:Sporulation kinase E [Sporotomaculum syntrophicum]|uniref:histidine kinase n=1 Tax=Sporotomaculum syntrophicum TaxID=182264 RepID=A0A9D2WQH8_9FIRM|nr:GAF domain-containing protein [Sporotomaculum syntrophicum]KAF1085233.1 Sporulation kinase E [Sporotomaculum syntrophicum]